VRVPVRGYIDKNGRRVRPYVQNRAAKGGGSRTDQSGGRVALTVALSLVVVVGGGGVGLVGFEADGSSSPSLPDISVSKGKANDEGKSWERKGIKYIERAAKTEVSCVIASHGDVQAFLAHTPCRSLRRYILAGTDSSGDTGVVSVVKIEMYDRAEAIEFKSLLDRPGSGDITPLGADNLKREGITFTGLHYASKLDGSSTVVEAEAEPAGSGRSTSGSLRRLTTVALGVPDM
jgi:hypothetical protein